MVISETMAVMLNAQVGRELGNRNLYLHFASWCHVRFLKGLESFFNSQADGELEHSNKIKAYIDEANAVLVIPAIDGKPSAFSSCEEISSLFVEAEAETTRNLMALWTQTEADRDIGTQDLLQWFLREQIEEEGLADRFSRLVEMAGGDLLKLDLMFK